MKALIVFDENNYIQGMSYDEAGEYELPENFNEEYSFCYQLKKDKLVFDENKYKKAINDNKRIEELGKCYRELNDTDFMVIKSYEYYLAGLEIPYDFAKLHKQRQELRDKINELEN